MSLKVKSPPAPPPMLKNTATAPILYFDGVPTYGIFAGNLEIDLAARVLVPKSDGNIGGDMICVAHLRCSRQAATMLRDTLNNVLEMLAKSEMTDLQRAMHEGERSPLLNN
jgi:hypothetical protein